MQRLTGLDASFLYLATSSQPMHVCSIVELDTSTMPGGYTFDRLRDALSLRLKAMPAFREKLANSPLNRSRCTASPIALGATRFRACSPVFKRSSAIR
jgi:hypothetical protein